MRESSLAKDRIIQTSQLNMKGEKVPKSKKPYKFRFYRGEAASNNYVGGKMQWFKNVESFISVKDEHKQWIVATSFTSPDWLEYMGDPIFGLCTTMGGLLSHAAITARELQMGCLIQCEKKINRIKSPVDAFILPAWNSIVIRIENVQDA